MTRPTAAAPDALARGISEFNSWRFYDCHETLEDVWREEEAGLADFYQGIIKVAAGFHHLLRGNRKGAITLLAGGLDLLEPFRPACLGVDVKRLIEDVRPCLEGVRALPARDLGAFDRALIPRVHMAQEASHAP
ncbi:MAG TPA: DUF309 domain-containing protein [Dehalococcoidia bacterium]|nr:DUF309 domain-containing protein [Dehalococcoidia bacterium]